MNNTRIEEKKSEWFKKCTDESFCMEADDVDELSDPKDFIDFDKQWLWIESLLKEVEQEQVTENTSDGYHTFKELYEYRMLYNAAFFNSLMSEYNMFEGRFKVHKSWRHSDGELCFGGGWFIVMATLPTGQISNHYPAEDWDLFQVQVLDKAQEWDGHTPQEAAKRIREYLTKH